MPSSSIYRLALYFFANGYLCYMFLLFKNNPVQYRSLWWVKCHEKIELWWTRYELLLTSGKSWSSRRYMKEFVSQRWSKSCLDRLIRKLDAGLLTDSFIGRGRIRATFFENLQPVWDVHVRIHVAPLACYAFINIKLAAYHLLLYVVYLC